MNTFVYNKETPILFLIFNRPDNSHKVFEAIRKAKPKRLYVSADGPRSEEEKKICEQTRAIFEKIDWECTLHTNFSDYNKGCKIAISEGISWFFNHETEGIILEDDCLPSDSFFAFCSTLLLHYRHDTRVTTVCGSNLQFGHLRGDASYYFSAFPHIWGWASWRRVWKDYDVEMKTFPIFRDQDYIKNCQSYHSFKTSWLSSWEKTYTGEINTWDFQYAYLNLINNGLSIIPNVNLISNIGFGDGATHTTDKNSLFSNMKNEEISTLVHPVFILPDVEADILMQEKQNYVPPAKKKGLLSKTWKSIRKLVKKK